MAVVTEHMKWRRTRNQLSHPISETDPTPQIPSIIPSIIQSTRCKSTISSLLLSTFSNNNNNNNTSNETTHSSGHNRKKKKNNNTNTNKNNHHNNSNFSAATFRGLGCTAGASQQVSVPAVIRSSADWQGNKKNSRKKKKHRRRNSENSNKTCHHHGVVVVDGSSSSSSSSSATTCVDFQDVWCGPGIGFSADAAAAASVDCVVARKNVSSRGKLDVVERVTHRERPPYLGRRTINTGFSSLDDDPDIFTLHPGSESFATSGYYRDIPRPSSDGLAEIMILQGRLLIGGRLNSHDQFRDWRLDVDNMSYEQLLELGERIGYVNTGLKEDEMGLNIRKTEHVISNDTSKHQIDKKCSICQEEYEADDELGRLNCEHNYHFQCIKQWLVHKNSCPVCKQEVVVRH